MRIKTMIEKFIEEYYSKIEDCEILLVDIKEKRRKARKELCSLISNDPGNGLGGPPSPAEIDANIDKVASQNDMMVILSKESSVLNTKIQCYTQTISDLKSIMYEL